MPVRESLEFDLRAALNQIGDLERMIDDLRRPVRLDMDIRGDAAREIETIDDRLTEIVDSAQAVTRELDQTEGAAARAAGDFSRMSYEMGTAETNAAAMAREIIQADQAAGRLDSETDQTAAALGRAEREAASLVEELRQADRAAASINTTTSKFNVGVFAGVGAGFASAAAGVGAALIGANAAVQSFATLEDSINSVNVIFKEGAQTVLEFGETAAESAGLSETAFNQAVGPIGSLLQNFGFDARQAADASVILVQRAADMASVLGGTVPEALAAVSSALRGESDPLEAYGASISAARVEAFALAEGLASSKGEITDAIKLQARYGLILQDTQRFAGDYANTAGDLANLQRSAGAAAQEFGTDIGEVLAPAMEQIVGLVPELLEGLRQLVPGFAAAGDSAAEFFSELGEGGGFREEAAGAKAFFDAATVGPGLVAEMGLSVAGLARDILNMDTQFTESSAAIARGASNIERAFTASIGVKLAGALDRGENAVESFQTAVEAVAAGSSDLKVFTDRYTEFYIAAGLSGDELRDVTLDLITNADAIGLTAEEVSFLEGRYAALHEELGGGARNNADYAASVNAVAAAIAAANAPGKSEGTLFTTFTAGIDEVTGELNELPAAIQSIQERVRVAVEGVSRNLDPFAGATEQIEISAREYTTNLITQINEQAGFQAALALLVVRGRGALAESLAKEGPAAASVVAQYLANDVLAAGADQALRTGKTEFSTATAAWLEEAIAGMEPGPARDELARFLEEDIITSPEVEGAIVRGTARSANTTVSSFRDSLTEEFENMDISPITERMANLFAGLTIDLPMFAWPEMPAFPTFTPPTSGSVTGGTGGWSNTFNTTIVNPTTTDLPTNTSQLNQSLNAVGTHLNRIGGQ